MSTSDDSTKARKAWLLGLVLLPFAVGFGSEWFLYGRRHAGDREKAYLEDLKHNLRNLVAAEEAYFADNVTYTTSPSALRLTASPGVTIIIGSSTGTGWNATAAHEKTRTLCGIYVGSATAPISGSLEGEPACVNQF